MPDLLRRIPTPRACAAVASLAALGVDPQRVELIPVGPLESFRGEVVGQIPAAGTPLDERTAVILFVARNGLAERLPHEFLEPLPTTQDEAHVAIEPGQTLDFWERQVGAYGPGRRLITVLDKALGRLDRDLERLRDGLSLVGNDPAFARRGLAFVGLADLPLDDQEAIFLASELQRLHRWVGPAAGIATVLEQFLGLPVAIVIARGPGLCLPQALRAPLGTSGARLGEGVLLGPQFVDPAPKIIARIGPVPLSSFLAFDRDATWRAKAQALLAAAAPAGVAYDIDLVLRPQDRHAVLGDPWQARLGRTSYLAG